MASNRNRYLAIYTIVAVLVATLDQWTKHLAATRLSPFESVKLIPGLFDLSLTTNTGAAFSIFSNKTPLLAAIALIIAIGITIAAIRMGDKLTLLTTWALALPVGGAIGNFVDRAFRGYVIDFFDLHIGDHHWPIFNVADSCICIGVGIIALIIVRPTKTDALSPSDEQDGVPVD
jgi:signal peptidase II